MVYKYTALLAAMALGAWAQESVIVKAVEPEWGFPTNEPVLTMPVWVTMTVLADGTPWEIDAETPLPIPLLRALQKYQMRPNRSAYRYGFQVEMRQLQSSYKAEAGGWPSNLGPVGVHMAKLTNAKKAAEMEASLKEDIASVEPRSALVIWASRQNNDEARAMRTRQLVWLIEHFPESEVLRSPLVAIDRSADQEGFQRVAQAWSNHFNTKTARPFAVGAAVTFFRFEDPAAAEGLLKAMQPLSHRVSPTLGEMYVYTALGARGMSPTAKLQPGEFAQPARAALAASNDVRLLMAARNTLFALAANPQVKDFESLCETISTQLKKVLPNAPGDCVRPKAPAPPPGADGGGFAGAGGGGGGGGRGGRGGRGGGGGGEVPADSPMPMATDFGPQVSKDAKPVYPADAKEKKYQGRVTFSAVIGANGKARDIRYVRGPLPLALAALEVLEKREYRPMGFGGQTIEIPNELHVDFKL